MDPEAFRKKLEHLFKPYPEAAEFVIRYNEYVHLLDDLVDEPKNTELILKTADMASTLFSSNFYVQNKNVFHVIEKLANNTYADSVDWELSGIEWKQNAAMTLRHCGLDMFYATILLCFGREKLREVSAEMREYTFLGHLNDVPLVKIA